VRGKVVNRLLYQQTIASFTMEVKIYSPCYHHTAQPNEKRGIRLRECTEHP